MKRAIKWIASGIATLLAVPVLYLLAAWIGAYVSWSPPQPTSIAPKTNTIFLLTSPLHVDIAIQATPQALQRFSFLSETSVPVTNPNLRYLAFGWGSRAFYTTAGSYSDIGVSAVSRAVTGDDAVMRVVGYGDVSKDPNAVKLRLSNAQVQKLIAAIELGFASGVEGWPKHMPAASIGQSDAFFEGAGHFNIFHPCNQWVRDTLERTGLKMGLWTPTTFALVASVRHHNFDAQSVQP